MRHSEVPDVWRNHPELQEGEVFLTNASDDPTGWDTIEMRTKRRGNVAYDVWGNSVPGLFPVFVQRKELEEAGINPDRLWTALLDRMIGKELFNV